MKMSFKLLFTVTLSMFLFTNCRTGDDGTNNHGKATEGIRDRVLDKDDGERTEYNKTEQMMDEPSDTIDRVPM